MSEIKQKIVLTLPGGGSSTTGSASVIIKSPDNSSWIVTVNNAGVLTTTKQ